MLLKLRLAKSIKVLTLVVVIGLLGLTACTKNTDEPKVEGQEETGRVLDITEMAGQSAITTPGDILYLKLVGESNSGLQWQAVAPTSGNYLLLKDHEVIGLDDSNILEGQFTDEYWLKVEETGEFNLKFDYVTPAKANELEDSFEIKIISQ
jgi:chagasin family peptidase inhibitor I42